MDKLYDSIIKLAGARDEAQRYLISSPEGSLRAVKLNNSSQFFIKSRGEQGTGKYLSLKDNRKIICSLAQKQYCKRVLKEIPSSVQLDKEFVRKFDIQILKTIYSDFNPLLKPYIKPFDVDDEEFVQRWENEKYTKCSKDFGQAEYFSKRGERVRSKSEIIISDYLFSLSIPYRYEQGYLLANGTYIFPDFTVLNKRTRQEFILEHFGMMDSETYRDSFFKKLVSYSYNGFIIGYNLIPTFEDADHPLNTHYLRSVVERFLL